MFAADISEARYEIVHAPDVITNDESPTEAIRKKPDSSLVKALEYLRNESEAGALVSCGSTGAVLAGGLLKVGRIKGILRPALAPVLPALNGGDTLLIDCGANVDCKPAYLAHFALMGSAYMRAMFGVENPRVALLSVGTEDKKGNELTRAAFGILKTLPINFVGNMESRDLLSGGYDVVVTDGFAGNVALKSMEGALKGVLQVLKGAIASGLKTKIGGALLSKRLKKDMARLDYTKAGGAPFLGIEKVIIKGHGSSRAYTVYTAILQAQRAIETRVTEVIRTAMENLPPIDLAE
jgi:glycerol-3-phosphate acyltransferase PlsX